MISKTDETADTEGDLTPAWHPKCPSYTPQLAPSDKAEDRRAPSGSLTPQSPAANGGRIFYKSESLLLPHSSRDAAERGYRRGQGEEWRVSWGRWDPPRGLDQALVWGEGKASRGGERGERGEGKERGGVCV